MDLLAQVVESAEHFVFQRWNFFQKFGQIHIQDHQQKPQ